MFYLIQALRKAHEATKSARESSDKVDDALKKVNDILVILGMLYLMAHLFEHLM